jgi:aminopeptidase YwaD
MDKAVMLQQISTDLNELCVKISNRHVGSPGNREAGRYAARRMTGAGLNVSLPEFSCIDWEHDDAILTVNGNPVKSFPSPYSPACELNCYFETAATIDELEARNFTGKVAVFHGDLCKEQLVPRNYAFYNRDEHKKILNVIDQKKPLAIIAITSRNPETTGGEYPFPLFEDGDFNIPSVYLTEEEGSKLLNIKDLAGFSR